MVKYAEYVYDVQFELIGMDGLIFEDEIEFGDFKLKSEKSEGSGIEITKIIGTTTVKLDKSDHKLARELAIQKIQRDLLPFLILSSNVGYVIGGVFVKLRPIIKRDEKNVFIELVESVEVSCEVHSFKLITKENLDSYSEELKSYKDKIEKLSKEDREDFLRAVRFWNRGFTDSDCVDKFINFFIAFEILGKSLVGDIERWINEVCRRYGLNNNYEGYPLSQIRAALLHHRHGRLTKEKAEKLVEKYANAFGRDVLKLIKVYLNEKAQ